MTTVLDQPVDIRDRLITLQGDWDHFQRLREVCEQTPNIKLAYF